MLWDTPPPRSHPPTPITPPRCVDCVEMDILAHTEQQAWYYISVERQGTVKPKQEGQDRRGKAMNVWEKLGRLTDYLGEDVMLEALVGYIPISQLENAMDTIAWENDISFDDDESED